MINTTKVTMFDGKTGITHLVEVPRTWLAVCGMWWLHESMNVGTGHTVPTCVECIAIAQQGPR